jgi:hypothetical protein
MAASPVLPWAQGNLEEAGLNKVFRILIKPPLKPLRFIGTISSWLKPCPDPNPSFAIGRGKADAPAGLYWRLHQLADRVEYSSKLRVVMALHLIQALGQLAMGGNHFSQLYESAHDGDVDFDSARAAQNSGQHGYALLGKGIRMISTPAATLV